MKKLLIALIVVGLIAGLFAGCIHSIIGIIPGGDEGEGEGESEPEQATRVVMAELFVAPTCKRCPEAKEIMSQLLAEYGYDKLVVLEEYAWDYGDYMGWATQDTRERFHMYLNYLNISGETPDTYFNGLSEYVHYNEYNSYSKYKAAIEKELSKPLKVSISASYSVMDRIVTIGGSINNISSEILNNIFIGAMIYEDSVYLGSVGKNVNHVVRDIITSEIIDSFSPEEEPHTFSLVSDTLKNVKNMNNIHVVVFVQAPNSPTKEILQALYVEVE